jgi:hypothetical protein
MTDVIIGLEDQIRADHKGESRCKPDIVLMSAAALFQEQGFDGIGLADLMRSAGMTHGSFYKSVESKEEIEVETCRPIFARGPDLTKAP